jgi:hypothetical protein
VTAALWIGAIGGTLLGQYFALHNYRLWIAAVALSAIGLYCAPVVWAAEASAQLWLSFIPAALCGFWSLGDRSGLAALWFPTVLWMLTILDRSDRIAPEGPAALLLGALAALFVGFLCFRESRRVALWRTVAAEPVAPALPTELLREPPGRQLARVAWWLTVGAITAAITVWLVPPLWQSETLGGPPTPTQRADAFPAGLPCCPIHGDADTRSSRIKEYLDLGLGHDPFIASPREGIDCRRCNAPAHGAMATGPGGDIVPWSGRSRRAGSRITTLPDVMGPRVIAPTVGGHAVAPDSQIADTAGGADLPAGTQIEATVPADPDPWTRTDRSSPDRPGSTTDRVTATDPGAAPSSEPTGTAPDIAPVDDPWATRRTGAEPTAAPPPTVPDPQHMAGDETPGAAPAADHPLPATAPIPAPTAPASPPSEAPPPPPSPGVAGQPTAQSRTGARLVSPSLLHWLAFAVVAAVVSQLVRLGLRPLRRLVTLRHLRRPFWDETIAQRVSNAWQLALVGLRDAGWRTGPSEAPRDLARRVGVDGLDRCAAVLERARHGVGLDAGDLADVQTSADTAYRAARTGLGGLPRLLAWLRWPLT